MTIQHFILGSGFLATMLASAGTAIAQPAAAVDDEPVPGSESGRIDTDPGDSKLRRVARGALFLPRVVVDLAFAPLEGGAWVYERYHLGDRAAALFFNDAGTIGLVPTLSLESGFGINAGARFVDRDLFGAREHFDLAASTGGRFHQRVGTTFRTGDRLGRRMSLELGADYERRPGDSFYGIGNADEHDVAIPDDPLSVDIASDSRYRHQVARVTAGFDARVWSGLHVRAASALADHVFGASERGPAIAEVYRMDEVVGLRGVRNAYGELELRWDSRRRASEWEVASVPSAGWLLATFGGRSTALDDGANFWRYGVDLQKFVSLGDGPRVLSLRSHGEAVSGGLDAVPFIDLPRLGGGTLLRGYPVDRFRDRVAVAGTVEYQWDLARFLSASLFVDAGRVSRSVRDIDLHDLRVGYGIALDAHSQDSFIARATLASSIDGGVFLNLALDPAFELAPRTKRR